MNQSLESFANHLKMIRAQKNLTQSELLEQLVAYDCSFHKLDLTTLSRWERGITTPNLAKQILITRGLNGKVSRLLKHKKNFLDNSKLDYSISRVVDPYSISEADIVARTQPILTWPETIKDKINIFHYDFLGIEDSNLITKQNNLLLTTYSDTDHDLLAHCIYGYISETEITNVQSDFFIPTHIRDKNQNIILNIVSAYSSCSKPRHLIFEKIMKAIMANHRIKGFIITVQYQEIFDFFNILVESEILTKGKKASFGGVKVHNKHYDRVQIYIKSEQIIASKYLAHYLASIEEKIRTSA